MRSTGGEDMVYLVQKAGTGAPRQREPRVRLVHASSDRVGSREHHAQPHIRHKWQTPREDGKMSEALTSSASASI
eukprot:5531831-Prymnesium_polylepis.1